MAFPSFPKHQIHFTDRSYTKDISERAFRALDQGGYRDGYLTVTDGDEHFYALLRGGRFVRTGQMSGGRAFDLTVTVFEHLLDRAERATFSLYGIEPMLFEALDLVLSRHPALYGSGRYLALSDLARTIRREGRNSVLTFGTGDEINIAVFRHGIPHRLYMADHLAPRSSGTILDGIDRYLQKLETSRAVEEPILAVYDGIGECEPLLFAPAHDEQSETAAPAATPRVSIMFRGRTVGVVELAAAVTTVGRVKENDIVIDNLGVSRVHCAFVKTRSGGLVLEDRGSLNGVVLNDAPVRRAQLADGDVVVVGKHRLIVGVESLAPVAAMPDERTLQAYDATMILDSKSRPDLLVPRMAKEALPLSAPPPDPSKPATRKGNRGEKSRRFATPSGAAIENQAARTKGSVIAEEKARALPRLVFDEGPDYQMVDPVTTIGAGDDADLKVDGFLVRPSMAEIVKDGTGRYRLVRRSRLHRPRINGSAVADEEILLDGDEVRVGSQRFVFTTS